jgi:signal peptidase II
MNKFKQFYYVGIIVFLLDQLSKFLVTFIGFQINYNSGVSLSFFSETDSTILTISLIALVIFLFKVFKKIWRENQLIAGLFFGGAVANIFDRIIFGSVRDWLSIPSTQIQNNIADIAIFLGLFFLVNTLVIEKKLTGKVK